jgi:hypothetical protein
MAMERERAGRCRGSAIYMVSNGGRSGKRRRLFILHKHNGFVVSECWWLFVPKLVVVVVVVVVVMVKGQGQDPVFGTRHREEN